MTQIQRQGHTVTLTHEKADSYTFNGLLFGISPGCWLVNPIVAHKICKAFGYATPNLGYERKLANGCWIANEAGRYRVTLAHGTYTYFPNN